MKRHELDVTSLVAGLVFLGIALTYLLAAGVGVHLDPRWVAPSMLVLAGTAGLLVTLSRLGREAGSRPRPGRPAGTRRSGP